MNNPEVQQIMGDPAMRMILEQMQTDPQVSGKDSHVLCQLKMSILEKEVKGGFLVKVIQLYFLSQRLT